jgi:hypothetical protein
MIYIGGSLANPNIRFVANRLRAHGFDVFDDWHAAGIEGDLNWKQYASDRGLNYKQALDLPFVQTAFDFDMKHLREADTFVLVMPAGKSGFLELGLMTGWGKRSYILFDGEPDRPDLMTKVATGLFDSFEDLVDRLALDAPEKYLSARWNQWTKVSGAAFIPKDIQVTQRMFTAFEASLVAFRRWVDADSAHAGFKRLAFKSSRIYVNPRIKRDSEVLFFSEPQTYEAI